MRRNGTPPPFRRFSTDMTWCVPRNMRIRNEFVVLVNFTPSGSRSHYNTFMSGYVPAFAPKVPWALVSLISGAAILLNIPLGYVREGLRKFSLGWFVCVHLSVPFIAWLRLSNHVSAWGIPVFVACAVLGQIAGGKIRRRGQ
jgi:hypothetical protein